MTTKQRPAFLTAAAAAKRLQVSSRTLIRYVEQGLLTEYKLKVSGYRRYDEAEIDALLIQTPMKEESSDDTETDR